MKFNYFQFILLLGIELKGKELIRLRFILPGISIYRLSLRTECEKAINNEIHYPFNV
jgi:hypothetical protein